MNAYTVLAQTLTTRSGAPVLRAGNQAWDGPQLLDEVGRHAALLQSKGLKAGERVLVQLPDSAAALLLYLACLRLQLVCVPLPMAWPVQDLAWFIAQADPQLLIGTADRLAALAGAHTVPSFTLAADDGAGTWTASLPAAPLPPATVVDGAPAAHPALILYGSSRDGQRPQGALISHARLLANAAAIAERWALYAEDRVLCSLPLFSMAGLAIAVHATLGAGASLDLAPRLAGEAGPLPQAQLSGATVLLADPATYAAWLEQPGLQAEHVQDIRLFGAAGTGMRKPLAEAWAARFGAAPRQCYGSAAAGLVSADYPDARARAGTAGKVLPGRRLRIVGANLKPMPIEHLGEIQLPECEGWWGAPPPDAMTADGWLRTGDIGQYDEEDYISLAGRSANRFVSGYYIIDPDVIEAVLEALPGVAEGVVIDIPDPELRARSLALVVEKPGAGLTAEGVLAALRAGLPQHLVPHAVRLVDSLPRHPLGAVLRGPLRQRFAQG